MGCCYGPCSARLVWCCGPLVVSSVGPAKAAVLVQGGTQIGSFHVILLRLRGFGTQWVPWLGVLIGKLVGSLASCICVALLIQPWAESLIVAA